MKPFGKAFDKWIAEETYRALMHEAPSQTTSELLATTKISNSESSKGFDVDELLGNPDAQFWAREFMRLNGGSLLSISESVMEAWFANAIMAGHDHAMRALRERVKLTPEEEAKRINEMFGVKE